MMHRTHICLPEETYQALKTIARLEQAKISEKLRQFIQEGVAKTLTKPKKKRHYSDLLAKLKFKGKIKDASTNLDKYLYDNPHNL